MRAWLIEGGDPDGFVEGVPLWAWSLEHGTCEGVAELLAAGADPNRRTDDGRGWLHWTVATAQPEWLIQAGLARLGETWWVPDAQGRTPFHLGRLAPSIGQSLAARWWAEGRDWALLETQETPEAAAMRAQNPALARVWRGWSRALHPG